MQKDLVIDTNIIIHSYNVQSRYYNDSLSFILRLYDTDHKIVFDEGVNFDESKNSSLICGEYLEHAVHGNVLFALLISNPERIKEVSRKVPGNVRKVITQRVSDKRDRTFVFVTFNTNGRLLISCDFEHFGIQLRTRVKSLFNISIVDSTEANRIS